MFISSEILCTLSLFRKLKNNCWREGFWFQFRSKEKSVRNLWKLAAPVGDSSTKMDSSRFEDETWCVCLVEEEARVSSSSTGSGDEEGSSSFPFQQGWMSHGKGHDCLEREAVWEQNDLSLSADKRTLSLDSSRRGPFNHSTFHSVTTNIMVRPPFYRRYSLAGTQNTTLKWLVLLYLFYLFHCVYWLFAEINFIKQSKKYLSSFHPSILTPERLFSNRCEEPFFTTAFQT